jgi:hypothetical protein
MVATLERPADYVPDDHECAPVPALDFTYNNCGHMTKIRPFTIPVDHFEPTLITALQQIGFNAIRI